MDFAMRVSLDLGEHSADFPIARGRVGAMGALAYWRNSRLERARWLSSLYSKFYEALDLKMIRETLDCTAPNAPEVRKLVQT